MERWFDEAEANTVEGVAVHLVFTLHLLASTLPHIKLCLYMQVGAKLDKAETGREVPYEEGQALADAHGALFCEASAKTRENVRKPFCDIVNQIVSTPGLLSGNHGRTSGTVAVGPGDGGYLSSCSC
jgi:Ras-related protein Rab-18